MEKPFITPDYSPKEVTQKRIADMFELFTGVNEDKYGNQITVGNQKRIITLLRLASINEKDNMIKSEQDLKELEDDLQKMRSKKIREINKFAIKDDIKQEKYLLKKNDFLITTRGKTRLISVNTADENGININSMVATQHFIYLRPERRTIENYGQKYLELLVVNIVDALNRRSEDENIFQLKLRVERAENHDFYGFNLHYKRFKEGEEIKIVDKQGNIIPLEKNQLYNFVAVNVKNPVQDNIKFSVKNDQIEEIPKSQFSLLTINELGKMLLNIDEDKESRQKLTDIYLNLKADLNNAETKFDSFKKTIQNSILKNNT